MSSYLSLQLASTNNCEPRIGRWCRERFVKRSWHVGVGFFMLFYSAYFIHGERCCCNIGEGILVSTSS